MATWKKVIVSGSNAELNQITASGGINATLPSSQQTNFVSYNSASGQLGFFSTGSLTAATASYVTGSNVYGPYGSNSILSASYATTASFVTQAVSASFATLAQTANTASYVITAQTASYVLNAVSASYATTANSANTASYVLNAISASYATNALNATNATNATNTAVTDTITGIGPYYVTFVDNTTGNVAQRIDSNGLTYNATTNTLTVSSSYANQANSASYVLQAVSASFATLAQTANTASFVVTAQTASYVLNAVSASLAATASNIFPAITNNSVNRVLTANGGGTINGESNLQFNGSTLTVSGDATITGNLSVAGTASFTNTDNLNIKDKFILINSGSTTLADSGWITQYNAAGSGSAFYLEAGTANDAGPYGRFAVAFDAVGTSTSLTPSEYVVTAKINQASAPTTAVPPTWGTGSNGSGNMWIMNNAAGDIYIYS